MNLNAEYEDAMEHARRWMQAWGAACAKAMQHRDSQDRAALARAMRAVTRMGIASDRRNALWLAQRNAGLGPWACLARPGASSGAEPSGPLQRR